MQTDKNICTPDIHLSNLPAFMIPPQNRNPSSKPNLQRHQQCHRFQGVISPIDIISHEQIVGLRALSPNAKEFGQVVELAVNVAADCDGGGDGLDVGFFTEYFFCL